MKSTDDNKNHEHKDKSEPKYKDTFFRTLFREKNRAIELVNAVEGTNYPLDAPAFICNTENKLLRRHNDSAIAVEGELLVFSEHQTKFSENVPLRLLAYATDALYTWFVDMKKVYETKVYKIPTPKFYVLYNGEGNPKQDYLKLSDSFKIESDELSLELKVKVININYSKGGETLDKSPSLKGYSYLIHLIREHQRGGVSRDKAIGPAIKQCIEEGVLADFLTENFKEVADMLAYEYSIEDELEVRFEEGEESGIIKSAKKMLNSGIQLSRVIEILDLSSEHVEQLDSVVV